MGDEFFRYGKYVFCIAKICVHLDIIVLVCYANPRRFTLFCNQLLRFLLWLSSMQLIQMYDMCS